MSHTIVKLLTDDEGAKYPTKHWHLVHTPDGSQRTVCTGECFGMGEGDATYEAKRVDKGGITCPDCIKKINWFKSIKL